MIAATVLLQKLIVVTRNVGDFAHFDVSASNPFELKNYDAKRK